MRVEALVVLGVAWLTTLDARNTRRQTFQGALCRALGGKCDQPCPVHRRLPLCGAGLSCFLPDTLRDNSRARAKQCKNKQACRRRGGRCVALTAACATLAVPRYCQGSACTCCLGDDSRCKSSAGCKLSGGFCVKKRKCKGGKLMKGGCAGKGCSCCVPDKCKCGISTGERIVGGSAVAPPNSHPWMVGILVPKVSNKYICGGTLLNSRYVMTSALCLHDQLKGEPMKPSQLFVGVADHNQSSTQDDIPGITRKVKVKKVIVYEKYRYFKPGDDLGLLRLASNLDLGASDALGAACLPTNPKNSYAGQTGVASGWGVLQDNILEPSSVLQEVGLQVQDVDCGGKKVGNVTVTRQMLCAGGNGGGKDTCFGDSGGPLTVNQGGSHTVIGVTSFGAGCGQLGVPGVYTRVTAYLEWLLEKMSDASLCHD